MNFLIIDGNSIINRAFYGIKLLNAKDGHFTNAIFGFMNIFLSLTDNYHPEAVAVAFDVHQPTFRHKMYDGYKAGRKGMPAELFEQMEPLKELLKAYGAHIIEVPGYEADDILGTLSAHCPENSHCYIATGDRDSLQLVRDNVSVLLTSTKFGKTQTVEYTPQKIAEEYGTDPAGMIELKALQGDSSDNIPGVPGIGPKTAGELIKKYGSIDRIYSDIDSIESTKGIIEKLKKGKESAFFSRILGTIFLEVPGISYDISSYILREQNKPLLKQLLITHEMFKTVSRLGLDNTEIVSEAKSESKNAELLKYNFISGFPVLLDNDDVYVIDAEKNCCLFIINNNIYFIESENPFDLFLSAFPDLNKLYVYSSKKIFKTYISKGLKPGKILFDAELAAYLLNPGVSEYTLDNLISEYKISLPEINIEKAQEEIYGKYEKMIRNSAGFPLLCRKLRSEIEANGQLSLLEDIEIPLAEVLASMELKGIKISTKDIKDYSVVLSGKATELEKKIYELAGQKFNINSPKQLGKVLFEDMGLPCKKKTKTGYSTSAEVLEELAEDYPIVSDILNFRTFSKLRSTYCDGLLSAADDDGRVRCTFNQTETRTGRLSSTEPNLQNIPVRTETGRQFRKFFIAEYGNVIVDADYSQIELRVLAALSGDKNMTEAFNSGTDIHSVTASKVFDIPIEEVSSEMRSKAKAVNFGIVYGIGARSLSKNIKSTKQEAESFINSYLALYSSVSDYMDKAIEDAKEKGYSETVFKRRRYLPELMSSNHMLKAFGERVARNMPIQGTAADIIKIAMIKVYQRLKKEHPDCSLIMQVHDELMVECPDNKSQEICQLLKEEMENAVKLTVKLNADAHYGSSWYEAKG